MSPPTIERSSSTDLITSTHPPRNPQYSRNIKKYSFLIPIILGIGGFSMMGLGIREYLQTKTFGWLGISGGVSLTLSLILSIFEYRKKYLINNGEASARLPINSVPSDAMTEKKACEILSITQDQISDRALIDSKKTSILADLERVIQKLNEASGKSNPIITSIENMMQNVKTAYDFLVKVSN